MRGKGRKIDEWEGGMCVTGAKVLAVVARPICLSPALSLSLTFVSFYVYLALIRKLRLLVSLNETFDIKFNLRLFESRPKGPCPLPPRLSQEKAHSKFARENLDVA